MKKLLAIILALCMFFSMAACGSKQAESTEAAGGETKPAVQNSGATNEEPREAELNIMMSFPQYMDQWETYVKQFEEKMLAEENIKVTVNLEMPSSDQYESILQARLSGDDAPDLYTLHCNNLATYNDAGYLYDLSGEPLADVISITSRKPLPSTASCWQSRSRARHGASFTTRPSLKSAA